MSGLQRDKETEEPPQVVAVEGEGDEEGVRDEAVQGIKCS